MEVKMVDEEIIEETDDDFLNKLLDNGTLRVLDFNGRYVYVDDDDNLYQSADEVADAFDREDYNDN
jgi:hypothetical protein